MILYKGFKGGIVFAVMIAFTGCSSLSAPPPEHFYRLPSLSVDQPVTSPLLPGLLVLAELNSDDLHADPAMLYSPDSNGLLLHQYENHRWQDSPTYLVRQVMLDYLSMSGIADAVAAEEDAFAPNWRLVTNLRRFEQWRGEESAFVTVTLNMQLTDVTARKRVLAESYEEVVTLTDTAPLTSVAGYQLALKRILERMIADLPK